MENLVEEYRKKFALFGNLREQMEPLIIQLLKNQNIKYHLITSRTKEIDSLEKKIATKQIYSKLSQITDLVGCRIITYFEDEVDRIAQIIVKEFDVDTENSIDKRAVEFDRFGYSSLHYIVSINTSRLKQAEYSKFVGYKFEIQIRSILQHSWAEIEHDIGYKGENEIPTKSKRMFSRISALLETADFEFRRLRDELDEYEKNVGNEIVDHPEKVTLNQASLLSFITSNQQLQMVDKAISEHFKIDLQDKKPTFFDSIIKLLNFAEVLTIKDLISAYSEKYEPIIEFSKEWRACFTDKEANIGISGIKGFSLFDTAYYLMAIKKSKTEINEFLQKELTKEQFATAIKCIDAQKKVKMNSELSR